MATTSTRLPAIIAGWPCSGTTPTTSSCASSPYCPGSARRLGISGYWSLSGYAKRKVKSAVSFIFDFEASVARYVKERGVDGVICGHIDAAAIKEIDGITYINCGDWMDSCTAIIEHDDGRMELLEWGVQAQPATPEPVHDGVPVPEAGLLQPEGREDPRRRPEGSWRPAALVGLARKR